jgi:hypothetical protein
VEAVRALFPPEHLLVVSSEDLFGATLVTVNRVAGFLGLPPMASGEFPVANANEPRELDAPTRARLAESFAASNERLFELIGERYSWTSP